MHGMGVGIRRGKEKRRRRRSDIRIGKLKA